MAACVEEAKGTIIPPASPTAKDAILAALGYEETTLTLVTDQGEHTFTILVKS